MPHSSPAHLQALIDARGVFCGTLHMEISVAKTQVMVVLIAASPAVTFACNGRVVEQISTFRYLGMQFGTSGTIFHLISPLRAKVAASWTIVQQQYSQLQCGNTVNVKLQLLHSILVPSVHYGCGLWGMHSPRAALAKKAAWCNVVTESGCILSTLGTFVG